jgi:hypothetical protein
MFNQFGEAVAGISLSGPSVRVRRSRDSDFSAAVKAAADEIAIGECCANPCACAKRPVLIPTR